MKPTPNNEPGRPSEDASTWEDACLSILREVGARVVPVGQGAEGCFRVELPDTIACRQWGTPYRPHPPLHIAFDELAPGVDAGKVEVVTPGSRRAADIVDLALERGWLGVFHEVPDGRLPALWVLMEGSFDAWPLYRGWPAPDGPSWAAASPRPFALRSCWLVGWADLATATPAGGCRVEVGPFDPAAPAGGPSRLLVAPGPPPGGRDRRLPGRAGRLPEVLSRMAEAALACFQDALPDGWRPSRVAPTTRAGEGDDGTRSGHPVRLQLVVTMAAVVFVRPRRPWPPPALLAVGRPSP